MEFRVNDTFRARLRRVREAVEDGAEEGMEAVVEQAEQDARALKRWNDPGRQGREYPLSTGESVEYEWTVTGNSVESISGYVVGAKQLSPIDPRLTYSRRSVRRGSGYRASPRDGHIQRMAHFHTSNPGATSNAAAQPGVISGVVTMHSSAAPYLQQWEINNGSLPVTVEVFRAYWKRTYAPNILAPAIREALRRAKG